MTVLEAREHIDGLALGRRLRDRRRAKGITQAQLAARVGTSAAFIGYLENGERLPGLETLARLCAALEVSMDALALGAPGCDPARCPLRDGLLAWFGGNREN